MIKRTVISQTINAPLHQTFEWFSHSENYVASPIVFQSRWRDQKYLPGARRDIIMIAGWYSEIITDWQKDFLIQYRVVNSFPKVQQDFTEIRFTPINHHQTRVDWTIEVGMPNQTLVNVAATMARRLYGTIITAGKHQLEKTSNEN